MLEDADTPKVFYGDIRDFYDRGVCVRLHPAGLEVLMYIDTPGVYFDARGKNVSGVLAKEAGYDTEKFGRDKVYRDRMAAVDAELRAELEQASEGDKSVVLERDGLRLISIGGGRHYLEDTDGRRLNSVFVTEEKGRELMGKYAPLSEPEKASHTHVVSPAKAKVAPLAPQKPGIPPPIAD